MTDFGLGSLSLGALELVTPWALLLLLLPLAWGVWRRRTKPEAILFSRVAALAQGPRAGRFLTRLARALRALALVLLIIALARPRTGATAENVTSAGINIVLVIDISSSMLAEDFQPQNRIEVAKDVVQRFIRERKSDRLGVVSFSGEALTQVPLTVDYPVVTAAVGNLQPGQLEDGTAIGTAIATAANRLREAPGKSRVMILLTDGENNRGAIDPRTAAKAAAEFGIKIYSIGVGTEGLAPVPVGRGVFGLRFENREVRIDEPLLTDIAKTTGGRYFRARDAAALGRIYEQINALEKAPVQSTTYLRYTELYRWPLTAAVVLLIGELALLAWRAPLP